jgi:hypothetical protein
VVIATRLSSAWERYAWVAGIVFGIALVADIAVAWGVGVNQDDSAAKIANALHDHRKRLLVIAFLSVVYAAMFPIYLSRLYNLLRGTRISPASSAHWCWLAECSLWPCMPLATLGSRPCSGRSSRRLGLSTIRASPTRCT